MMSQVHNGMFTKAIVAVSFSGLMVGCSGGENFTPAPGFNQAGTASTGTASVASVTGDSAAANGAINASTGNGVQSSTTTPTPTPVSGSSGTSTNPGSSSSSSSSSTGGSSASSSGPVISGEYPPESTVCSPLNGGAQTVLPFQYTNGLIGRLYSLIPGKADPTNLAQLFANSKDVGVNLFLDDLNVPTRLFTEGFPAANGKMLADAQGNPLLEWFGMDMYSSLQLAPGDIEGPYQLAILSDDGAILDIKAVGNNNYVQFINNDGNHPTTMKCATLPLVVNSYDQIPIHLQYYQGPRYEIAMMMMWRPWPQSPSQVNDPLCGTSGNNQFFDPATSTPTSNYKALLARGWRPLAPMNYVIPEQSFNPCHISGYWPESGSGNCH